MKLDPAVKNYLQQLGFHDYLMGNPPRMFPTVEAYEQYAMGRENARREQQKKQEGLKHEVQHS